MTDRDSKEENWNSLTALLPEAETDKTVLRNWALVLSARGIPFRAVPEKKPLEIFIPDRYAAIALREIELYRNENRPAPVPGKVLKKAENSLTSLSVLILIAIFHNLTYVKLSGFGHRSIDWLKLGSADSSLILDGEWWRLATALTLHADSQHLLGNLLLGGYFIIRLCHITGSGLGWFLILFSGITGNLANTWFHAGGHNAVGASTAIFGAIGIAGAIGSLLSPRHLLRHWLLPLAAAAMLLAFFGASSDGRTDVAAHCFGFLAGILLGVPAGNYLKKKGQPGLSGNALLATAALTLLATSWLLALTM